MTELLYMNDFDVESCTANVVLVDRNEDRIDVILDQTCFYARGGGQDWDEGLIFTEGATFRVEETRIDRDGVVHHLGRHSSGALAVGDRVSAEVDRSRRRLNTRLHSAAHVIDMAVAELAPDWSPLKGQHYPNISAVEYEGSWGTQSADELRGRIEQRVSELVEGGSDNRMLFLSADQLSAYCRHVPKQLPENKPTRVVLYGDFGIPCGGTHVKNIQDVGEVLVTKLREKKGVIRLSYAIRGINA